MDYTTVLAKVKQTLEQRKDRSAWSRGVTAYAVDMLQQIEDYYKDGYISAGDRPGVALVANPCCCK